MENRRKATPGQMARIAQLCASGDILFEDAEEIKRKYTGRKWARRQSDMKKSETKTRIAVELTFTAPVVYVQPKFEELFHRFPGNVEIHFKDIHFCAICRVGADPIDTKNREIVFVLVQTDRAMSGIEMCNEMDRHGLRPALYEELLGFADQYPDMPVNGPIVALGSETSIDSSPYVAILSREGTANRSLELFWLSNRFNPNYRFLAVRKEEKVDLGENEYRVPVGYEMPRDKGKLEAEFSKDGVSELFYGNYEWQNHSSCADADQTPGNRVMLVKHFGRSTTSEANIVEMDKLGYRPATHLEAYAFAEVNPELQRQFWIVALGSSTMHGGCWYVAVLSSSSGRRVLGDHGLFGSEWDSGFRFLFVRK